METDKIKGYLYANLSSIFWITFLLIGGGIFVAYYAHIEYMPDFDLAGSVTVTAAAAITALFIVAVLLAMFVFPGIYWGATWGATPSLKRLWTNRAGERTFRGILIWFVAPLITLYVAVALSQALGWYYAFSYVVLLAGYYLAILRRSRGNAIVSLKLTSLLFFHTLVSSLIISIPLLMIVGLSLKGKADPSIPAWLAGLLSASTLIFVNILSATNKVNVKRFYFSVLLGSVALYVFLSTFDMFHRIPTRVVEIYKFGNIETEVVVLRREACRSVKAIGISTSYQDEEVCVVKKLLILSRLGDEVYMQADAEAGAVRFTVKAEQVASWAVKWTPASANSPLKAN